MATPHRDPEASPPARNSPGVGNQSRWEGWPGVRLPCQRPALSLQHLETLPLGLAFLFINLDLSFALDVRLRPVQASRPASRSRPFLRFCRHLCGPVRRPRPRPGAARATPPSVPLGARTVRSLSGCVTRGRGDDRRMHGVSHLLPWSPEPGLRSPRVCPLVSPPSVPLTQREWSRAWAARVCRLCPGRLPFRNVRIGGLYTEHKRNDNIIIFKHVASRDFLIFISPRKGTFLGTWGAQ